MDADADADADAEARRPSTDGPEPTHRHRAVIVDASDASPALVAATLDALSSDPPAEVAASDANTSMSAPRAALRATPRPTHRSLRRALARHPRQKDESLRRRPRRRRAGRACVASRDGSVFLAFHHVAAPLTLAQSLGLVTRAGGGELYRAARAMTLVVAVAYALWYRSMCVRPGERVDFGFLGDAAELVADAFGFGAAIEAPGDFATRAAKKDVSGASSPLGALEKPLTAALCAAGPKVAPAFGAAATATIASYALAAFRRLARRAAGRKRNRTKTA